MSAVCRAVFVILVALGVDGIAGCAISSVYEKCGWHGCPGDTQLSAAVRAAMAAYPSLQPPNLISIRTLDRVVYLDGEVATDTQSQLAESVAGQVKGVKRVVNNIGVTYAGP